MEKEELKSQYSTEEEKRNRLYCEKYEEWVLEELGCKHPKEYCQYRRQCFLNFKSKFKEF